MNLTDQQKDLLRKMVDVYTSGHYEPFIFVETLSEGASLVYSGHPNIEVAASKADFLRLREEGLIDCQASSTGTLQGKPSANGIILVQDNFDQEIHTFPNIRPGSIKKSQFFVIMDEDMMEEDAVNHLMAKMFHTSEAAFYFLHLKETPHTAPMQSAFARGDILTAISEYFYYLHPSGFPRDFVQIAGADIGQFNWDWERAVADKGPEYVRITLKLSECKRREMETMEKIHLEIEYRRQLLEEQNRLHVFLSYAAEDHAAGEVIQKAIVDAGGTVFMDQKSLEPGEDFAERIRAALYSCRELWILVSPSSLKSEWVMTEWGAAWVLQKTIVPILHQCESKDLPARLSKLQCIDMYRYPDLVAKRFSKSSPD